MMRLHLPKPIIMLHTESCVPPSLKRPIKFSLQGGLHLQKTKAFYPETWKCSFWQVDNEFGTFLAVRSLNRPQSAVAFDPAAAS